MRSSEGSHNFFKKNDLSYEKVMLILRVVGFSSGPNSIDEDN